MGRSVRDLAGEVDEALGRLAQAQGLEATAIDTLRLAEADVAKARADVAAARDALFKEHPHLAPDGWSKPVPKIEAAPPQENPGAWDPEPVEVDDPNDSRFTAGATVVDPSDDADLPPIVWGEHDA